MAATEPDDKMQILRLIESGQVSAEEGARLLDAVRPVPRRTAGGITTSPRSLRVRVTDLYTNRHKINVTLPVSLIGVGLKLGARLVPREGDVTIEAILRAVENGVTGRVYDLRDLEDGERIEIIVE